MAVLQGEFCAVNIEIAFRAKPNGRYIEVAVLQRAGIARVYCSLGPKDDVRSALIELQSKFEDKICTVARTSHTVLNDPLEHG